MAEIPIVWAALSGPFEAKLLFRVGAADEVLARRGLTHLAQHVAIAASGPREHPLQGAVGLTVTSFWAQGDGALEFLQRVCRALEALPEDDVEAQRQWFAGREREAPSGVEQAFDRVRPSAHLS